MDRVLEHATGALLVTGPPGSGKTRSLVERYARLVEGGADPERVLLLVLNRRAAREAREHLLKRLRRSLPALGIHTAHSFAFRVIGRRFGDLGYAEEPKVLSAAEQYATVRELMLNDPASAWATFGPLVKVRGFAREVADFVLRAQERLYDPASLRGQIERAARPGYEEVADFFDRYLDVMSASNRVDFAGMLHQAVVALQAGLAEEDRVDHLLVDDYQDITPAAEAIVEALAAGARSTVVAADPGGHVFAYRGGSLEPLQRIEKVLTPEVVELDGAGRLDPAALAALDDPAAPASEAPPRGVEARVFVHPGEEADAIAHELLRARVDDDVAWERMAVIVRRYGEYLTALRHALTRHNIPFVILGEASSVASEPANRPLIQLLRYVIRPAVRDDLIEPLLSSAVGGLDPHALRRMRREARLRDTSLHALVTSGSLEGVPEDLAQAVERFRALVAGLSERCPTRPPDEVFFWLWSNLPYARELAEGGRARDLDAVAGLSDIIGRFTERRGSGARMIDYLETLEAAEFGPDPWVLPEERRPHAVQVVSAHRAHGLSFDLVCVAGCVEGEFPAPGRASALIDIDHLSAPPDPAERLKTSLAEERRLFRLAVSRAARTILFASESPSGMHPRTPSRYANRIGFADWSRDGENAGPSASARSIEAELRRTLADANAQAGERLAALAALGPAGAEPRSWWTGRDWTDPGETLYPAEIRTSYSRLSNMEDCALKYLYEVEMGLDPNQSFQMWLGSLIHDIIDRVQREVIPREAGPVIAALEEGWNPNLFPNRAIEHRRRLDAEEMLRLWLVQEQAKVSHSEVGFEYPLGDAVIRGKIDAIFPMSTPGKLRLVDYKTGRYAPSKEEAQTNLQLGAYFLAMRRDPELAKLGRPGWLQLSYLGDIWNEKFKVPGFAPQEGYEEWAETTITELVGKIRAEDFAPNPAADCMWCEFKTLCPLWPQGGDAVR